jgi:hypothetical protein
MSPRCGEETMHKPRANLLVLSAAAVASLLPALLLAACLTAPRSDAIPPGSRTILVWPSSLVVAVLPALWLIAEYESLVRRSRFAAACLAIPLVWFAVLAPVGLVFGLLSLTGILPDDDEWQSWLDILLVSVLAVCSAYVAYGHMLWWRTLAKHGDEAKAVGQ